MRYPSTTLALICCFLFAQCGGSDRPADTARQNSNAANTATAPNTAPPPVASSHGGTTGGAANAAPGASSSDKAPVATAELDEKIEKSEAKAKAAGASAADKKAAADARMARGNFYYQAGDPRLYRYALGDFRTALRYDPDNKDAKDKIQMIESIYRSMGRPIPTNGLEQ